VDGERPVVADLVGAAGDDRAVVGGGGGGGGRVLVQAVAAPGVVRLPGAVGCLKQQGGVALRGRRDEWGDGGPPRVVARRPSEVDARDDARGDRPRGGNRPVAGIDESDGRVGEGRRLDLLEDLRGGNGRHQASAVALVVAHAVDVDVVRLVGGV